ncbi:hypothetical protein ACFQV2_21370 [Actinokineospora soli]|uniref:Uncharacterized protein n=1 Tax=Actinokineospora soli TaxID=1048753 RepID=A0ABW2TPE0_9PSEU
MRGRVLDELAAAAALARSELAARSVRASSNPSTRWVGTSLSVAQAVRVGSSAVRTRRSRSSGGLGSRRRPCRVVVSRSAATGTVVWAKDEPE